MDGDLSNLQEAGGNGLVAAGSVTFSTEDGDRSEAAVTAEPVAAHALADGRGTSNRVKVTVVNQYGDPIVGARVSLTSTEDGDHAEDVADGRDVCCGS